MDVMETELGCSPVGSKVIDWLIDWMIDWLSEWLIDKFIIIIVSN